MAKSRPPALEHLWAVAVVVGGVCIDQWSKAWAIGRLLGRPFLEVVPGALELRLSLNTGVGFGLGQGLPQAYRAPLLTLATAIGLAVLCLVYVRTRGLPDRLGMALLWAGGVGNLIDRLRRQEVVDFIHLRLGQWFQLGTFNLADVLIATGLIQLAFLAFGPNRKPRAERSTLG